MIVLDKLTKPHYIAYFKTFDSLYITKIKEISNEIDNGIISFKFNNKEYNIQPPHVFELGTLLSSYFIDLDNSTISTKLNENIKNYIGIFVSTEVQILQAINLGLQNGFNLAKKL